MVDPDPAADEVDEAATAEEDGATVDEDPIELEGPGVLGVPVAKVRIGDPTEAEFEGKLKLELLELLGGGVYVVQGQT